ncbi:MAG TPA: OmpA family protein [Planctomycetota bacterium]|nr:OmpA family protein [Planctomycetota bacterium]
MTGLTLQREPRSGFARAAQGMPVLALLALVACATPPTPQALLDAKAAYQEAESNPKIQKNASVELYQAKQALDRAQSEWTRDENVEETEHLAYLAKRRVEVAQEWATGREATEQADVLRRQLSENAKASLSAAEAAQRAAAEAAAREKKLREELSDLQARETARGIELTLGDILFDVDKASLKEGTMQRLYRLVTFLKEYPDRGVLVEGYTDSTGSESYNQSLSERRAESVRTFLTQNGIAANRVLARGYGKAYPVASNDTAEGRQRNRRVDIVILHAGESPEGRLRPPAP